MTTPSNTITPWEPRDKQAELGLLIASGYPRYRAAQMAGVPQSTSEQWWRTNSNYRAWITERRNELLAGQGARLATLFERCFDILDRVGAGDLDADDPLSQQAERILARTLFAAFATRMGAVR